MQYIPETSEKYAENYADYKQLFFERLSELKDMCYGHPYSISVV